MNRNDDDLFRQEMADVVPIKSDKRVTPANGPRKETLREKLRRGAAMDDASDPNPLSLPEQVPQVGPYDIVGLKKNGVQEGVYRKLRLGKYEAKNVLDLHRVRLKDARKQVYQFLAEAHEEGLRTVLISHGKGEHSARPGVLKSHVIYWLEESPMVLAFHSAPQNKGGAGATYVMVRKSPGARQRTREFYMEAGKPQRSR